MSLTQNLNYAP